MIIAPLPSLFALGVNPAGRVRSREALPPGPLARSFGRGPGIRGLRRLAIVLLTVAGVSLFLVVSPATRAGAAVGLLLGAGLAGRFAWNESRATHLIPAIAVARQARAHAWYAELALESNAPAAAQLNLEAVRRDLVDLTAIAERGRSG